MPGRRPLLECCRPWFAPDGWRHQSRCSLYANQKADGFERRRITREEIAARVVHPAGTRLGHWQRSPLIGPLDEWAAYFDAHLDDDDDERDRVDA